MAIRKQEIEDRLNSWIVFNEKNKELCAWLVQMENKVLQTADISIEEMIEKLQKVSGGQGAHMGALRRVKVLCRLKEPQCRIVTWQCSCFRRTVLGLSKGGGEKGREHELS